jgi:hypothetical protein
MLIQHIPVKLSCPCHSRATVMPRPCHFRSGPCHSLKSVAHSPCNVRSVLVPFPCHDRAMPIFNSHAQGTRTFPQHAWTISHNLRTWLAHWRTNSHISRTSLAHLRTKCARGSHNPAPTRLFPAPGSHWRGNSRTNRHIIAPGADIPAHWLTNTHISRTSLAHLRAKCAHGSHNSAPS